MTRSSSRQFDPTGDQLDSLSGYVNSAYAAGLIDEEDIKGITDKSNLVQRMLQLNGPEADNSGSVLETIGDVLNLPLQAIYGAAKQKFIAQQKVGEIDSTQDFLQALTGFDLDAIDREGLIKSKFGLQTAVSAWQNKETVSDFIEDGKFFDSGAATFGAGLAGDILFDPTTWLTYGIGAGTKVALSGTSKAALKSPMAIAALEKTGHLTMTRFGKRIYQEAVQELAPRFMAEEGRHIEDLPIGARWHQEATDLMVANFDRLKGQVLSKSRAGLWGKLKTSTPLTEAGRLALQEKVAQSTRKIAGLGVDDLFQEAGQQALELGVYNIPRVEKFLGGLSVDLQKLQSQRLLGVELKKLDVGRPFRFLFDTFDRGWDLPPDVAEIARLTYHATNQELAERAHVYYRTFSGLNKEQRELIPRIIESRAGLTPAIEGPVSEEMEAGIRFFNEEMDSVLKAEREAGFETGRADGYVAHVYAFNPHMKEMALNILRKNGEVDPKAINGFTQQRLIASIADGEEIFGDGALITDAYKLIMARKKASLELIHKDKLYRYIADNHGTPAAILHAVQQGASKGLIRGFFRRVAHGVQEILPMDQVYKATNGSLSKLGFKQGDHAFNRDLMRYLMRPMEDRLSEEGVKLADSLGLTEEARMHQVEMVSSSPVDGISTVGMASSIKTKSLPEVFRPISIKVREASGKLGMPTGPEMVRRQGPDFKVETMLDMLADAKHPAWDEVLGSAMGRKNINWENLRSTVYGFHKYLVRNLDAQLPGFIPDTEARLVQSVLGYAERHGLGPANEKAKAKFRNSIIEKVGEITTRMSGDIELRKLEPQLPDAFVRLARATRQAHGIKTDMIPASADDYDRIRGLAVELGFTPGPLKKFTNLIIGKERPETIYEAEAVIDGLRHWTDQVKVNKGKVTIRGEAMERVTIHFQQNQGKTVLRELTEQPKGIPTSEGRLAREKKINSGELRAVELKISNLEREKARILKTQEKVNAKTSPETGRLIDEHDKFVQESIVPAKKKVKAARDALKKIPARDRDAVEAARKVVDKEKAALAALREELKGKSKSSSSIAVAKAKQSIAEAKKAVQDADPNSMARRAAKARLKQARAELKYEMQTLTEKGAGKKYLEPELGLDAAKVGNDSLMDVSRGVRGLDQLKEVRSRITAMEKERAVLSASDAEDADVLIQSLDGKINLAKQELAKLNGARIGPTNRAANDRLKEIESALSESKLRLSEMTSPGDPVAKPGGLTSAPDGEMVFGQVKGQPVIQVQLENARAAVRAAKTPEEQAAALEMLQKARSNTTDMSAPQVYKGPIGVDVYVPESVAKVMRDLETPSINPKWSSAMKGIVKRYDAAVSFFKSNLMLPHGGYHMRNLYSGVAINYLAHGAHILDPKNNFRNLQDWTKVTMYALYKHTDLGDVMAMDRAHLGRMISSWGDELIETETGHAVKLSQFVDDMGIRGVYAGSSQTEILDSMLGNRLAGGLSGAAAGAAIGALTPGIAGQMAATGLATAAMAAGSPELLLGAQNAQQGAYAGSGWASLMGAAVGAALGGRGLRGAFTGQQRGWLGGLPVRNADRVTGMLQSNWKPLLGIGDAAIETPMRIAMFMSEFKKTGSMSQATNRMVSHMNDVFHMSAFERQVMRRIVPFYGWMKTAVRQSAHTLAEDPNRIHRIFQFVENWNGKDGDDKPDFLGEKFAMMGSLPWGEERKNSSRITIGAIPLEDVADMSAFMVAERPAAKLMDTFLSRGPMGLTSMVEYAINRDSFTGQEIYPEAGETSRFERGKDWRSAPWWLKKVVNYQEATSQQTDRVHPGIAWLLGEIPVSRFVAFTRQAYDAEGKISATVMARQFLGVSAYRYDPESQTYFENRRKIERMANLLDNIGQLKKFERYYQKDSTARGSRRSGR